MKSPLLDLKLKYKDDKGTMRRLKLIEQEIDELETELDNYKEIAELIKQLMFGTNPIKKEEWPEYCYLDSEDQKIISEKQWKLMKEIFSE